MIHWTLLIGPILNFVLLAVLWRYALIAIKVNHVRELETLQRYLENLQNRVIELERQVFKYKCEIGLDPREHDKHKGQWCCCGAEHHCDHLEHDLIDLPRRQNTVGETIWEAHCVNCCHHIYQYWAGNFECAKKALLKGVCSGQKHSDCEYCSRILANQLRGE